MLSSAHLCIHRHGEVGVHKYIQTGYCKRILRTQSVHLHTTHAYAKVCVNEAVDRKWTNVEAQAQN